jgi:hypothetical protein
VQNRKSRGPEGKPFPNVQFGLPKGLNLSLRLLVFENQLNIKLFLGEEDSNYLLKFQKLGEFRRKKFEYKGRAGKESKDLP